MMPVEITKESLSFEHKCVRYNYVCWRTEVEQGCGGGKKAPLVFLHGFSQQALLWEGIALSFTDQFDVYALDLIGHGDSEKPVDTKPYELKEQGETLLAFLQYLMTQYEQKKPHVVGYSMGGRVVLSALVYDPASFACCVGSFVLESVGLGPRDEEARDEAAQRDARCAARLRSEGVAAFMDGWASLPLFASQNSLPEEVRELTRWSRLLNDAEALARSFEFAGQHVMPPRDHLEEALACINKENRPFLYLCGQLDEKYRILAEQLATNKVSSVEIVQDVGHNVHLESPLRYGQMLRKFLTEQ